MLRSGAYSSWFQGNQKVYLADHMVELDCAVLQEEEGLFEEITHLQDWNPMEEDMYTNADDDVHKACFGHRSA